MAGLAVGAAWTSRDALISTPAREGRLGATMGADASFKELGGMVGPILIGAQSQACGLPVGLVSYGVLGLLVLALIMRVRQQGLT